ncbi:hypothetical protein MKK69_22745 [Methylobacterium sp. J-026]|uniref:hypothetical protein n=1 Tax=Methylobacterium sp. J-026 TaxID=2836624 RepID=UPI001FBAAE73|nr:hypothetical protein [Methylobacterium sp. J-026]MCJ2136834.1 hypothetical protein [Methylobacterium sp. J-026]
MPPARHILPVPIAVAMLVLGLSCTAGAAGAAGETATRHTIWRDCLARNFRIHAALTARDRAADAAFRACRTPESAYLDALAGSPLLDDEDVTHARPLLAGRLRAWLIGGGSG